MKKQHKKKQQKECLLTVTGEVTEASTAGAFVVKLPSGALLQAVPCGKLRQHNIQIVVGDTVECEASVYDVSRGRIVRRL